MKWDKSVSKVTGVGLALKDGESTTGVFAGDMVISYVHFDDDNKFVGVCKGEDCEICRAGNTPTFSAKGNWIIKDDRGGFAVKILQFSGRWGQNAYFELANAPDAVTKDFNFDALATDAKELAKPFARLKISRKKDNRSSVVTFRQLLQDPEGEWKEVIDFAKRATLHNLDKSQDYQPNAYNQGEEAPTKLKD